MAGEGIIAKYAMGGMFPEKDLLDIVHGHAKWGAIAMAIRCQLLIGLFIVLSYGICTIN